MLSLIKQSQKQLITMAMISLMSLASLLVLSGCGSDSNISAIINGQELSLPVDGVDIISGGIAGIIPPGNAGVPLSGISLTCIIRFLNGNVVDQLRFDILDAGNIFPGEQVFVDNANVIADLTINGVRQVVPPGSILVFDEIGISDGSKVRFEFQVFTAVALLTGRVDGKVRLGF